MPTNAEKLVKIGADLSDVLAGICGFFHIAKMLQFLLIFGVSGPKVYQNCTQCREIFSATNPLIYIAIFQSMLECQLRQKILFQNWLPWQRPLRDGKRGSDLYSTTKYLLFDEKIVKIGPVDPEIIGLR